VSTLSPGHTRVAVDDADHLRRVDKLQIEPLRPDGGRTAPRAAKAGAPR